MVRSYQALFARGAGLQSYGTFLLRRFARVYPVYALVTPIFIVLNALGYGVHVQVTPGLVLTNMTMTQTWFGTLIYNPPEWSLSTEAIAYLLFPLLLVVTRRYA